LPRSEEHGKSAAKDDFVDFVDHQISMIHNNNNDNNDDNYDDTAHSFDMHRR
jgi:hypothetical protein